MIVLRKACPVWFPVSIAALALTVSCGADLIGSVREFEAVYNRHDVEKIMSFYAPDAEHEVPGVFLLKGERELSDLVHYERVLNFQMTFTQCVVNGDTVSCELTATDDWMKLAGIENIRYSSRITFENGQISRWIATVSEESGQNISNLVNGLMAYVSRERPQALDTLMPEGRFAYNATSARLLLELTREWRESVQ